MDVNPNTTGVCFHCGSLLASPHEIAPPPIHPAQLDHSLRVVPRQANRLFHVRYCFVTGSAPPERLGIAAPRPFVARTSGNGLGKQHLRPFPPAALFRIQPLQRELTSRGNALVRNLLTVQRTAAPAERRRCNGRQQDSRRSCSVAHARHSGLTLFATASMKRPRRFID
jgi:hypothetical protein